MLSRWCFAQTGAPKQQSATASSQIRVRIPAYAIINLAPNNATAVSYHSLTQLKSLTKFNSENKVEGNSQWSVNVIASDTDPKNLKKASATLPHSYTVVYVTTRI